MTLEKEMIRLFDDTTGRVTNEKTSAKYRVGMQRCSSSETLLQRTSQNNTNQKREIAIFSKNKDSRRTETRKRCVRPKTQSWTHGGIDCKLGVDIGNLCLASIILLCFIVTLPQSYMSLPLPNPQLIVRSQSLLFSNQYGRQIDLTHKMPAQEVFWLNFEEGYFACQVNASQKFLKLFRLSRLCDGLQDCYQGTDELRDTIQCSKTCHPDSSCGGHGVCLGMSADVNNTYQDEEIMKWHSMSEKSSLSSKVMLKSSCICDDGFGGNDCSMADVNECKFRPCSPFADCRNTLGSYICECKSGYVGDGHTCDISGDFDEPQIDSHNVVIGISNTPIETPTFGVASSWVPFNDSFGVASSYIPFNESVKDPSINTNTTLFIPHQMLPDEDGVDLKDNFLNEATDDKIESKSNTEAPLSFETIVTIPKDITKSIIGVDSNLNSVVTIATTSSLPVSTTSSSSPLEKVSNIPNKIHSDISEDRITFVDTFEASSSSPDPSLEISTAVSTSVVIPVITRNNDTIIDKINYSQIENMLEKETFENEIIDNVSNEYNGYYQDDEYDGIKETVLGIPDYYSDESLDYGSSSSTVLSVVSDSSTIVPAIANTTLSSTYTLLDDNTKEFEGSGQEDYETSTDTTNIVFPPVEPNTLPTKDSASPVTLSIDKVDIEISTIESDQEDIINDVFILHPNSTSSKSSTKAIKEYEVQDATSPNVFQEEVDKETGKNELTTIGMDTASNDIETGEELSSMLSITTFDPVNDYITVESSTPILSLTNEIPALDVSKQETEQVPDIILLTESPSTVLPYPEDKESKGSDIVGSDATLSPISITETTYSGISKKTNEPNIEAETETIKNLVDAPYEASTITADGNIVLKGTTEPNFTTNFPSSNKQEDILLPVDSNSDLGEVAVMSKPEDVQSANDYIDEVTESFQVDPQANTDNVQETSTIDYVSNTNIGINKDQAFPQNCQWE